MAGLSMSEKGQIFCDVVTTTMISQVLLDVEGGKKVTSKEIEILNDGIALLRSIRAGSNLVEGKENEEGLGPAQTGLTTYGYALSALKILDRVSHVKGFTEYFDRMQEQLEGLATKGKATGDFTIADIREFFLVLGGLFGADLEEDTYRNALIVEDGGV